MKITKLKKEVKKIRKLLRKALRGTLKHQAELEALPDIQVAADDTTSERVAKT